jgi:hypothetical protein
MTKNPADLLLNEHLDYLKLTYVKDNCQPLAAESTANHWSHLDYLGRLLQGEVAARQERTIASASRLASRSMARYLLVVLTLACPSQWAMVLKSTPERNRLTAVLCRTLWG